MAEQDVLNYVIQTAWKQAAEHIHLVSGSETELKLLVWDRDLLNAILNDLGEQSTNRETLKHYEREVMTVVYKAQDIIDECLTRAARNSSKFHKIFYPKHADLAYKVKSFRREIIKPLYDKYGLGKIISPPPPESHSITTKPSDLKVTPPNQESIRCPKDEASSSTNLLNQEFKHEASCLNIRRKGRTSPNFSLAAFPSGFSGFVGGIPGYPHMAGRSASYPMHPAPSPDDFNSAVRLGEDRDDFGKAQKSSAAITVVAVREEEAEASRGGRDRGGGGVVQSCSGGG